MTTIVDIRRQKVKGLKYVRWLIYLKRRHIPQEGGGGIRSKCCYETSRSMQLYISV